MSITAEKKHKEDNAILNALKSFGAEFLMKNLKNMYENFLGTLQDYALQTQKRIIDVFTVFSLMAIGLVLVIIGFVFLLKEYLNLSWTFSFFIVGLVLIVLGFIMKSNIEKTNVRRQ